MMGGRSTDIITKEKVNLGGLREQDEFTSIAFFSKLAATKMRDGTTITPPGYFDLSFTSGEKRESSRKATET